MIVHTCPIFGVWKAPCPLVCWPVSGEAAAVPVEASSSAPHATATITRCRPRLRPLPVSALHHVFRILTILEEQIINSGHRSPPGCRAATGPGGIFGEHARQKRAFDTLRRQS